MDPYRIEVPDRFGLAGAFVMIRPRQSWSALNRVQSAGAILHMIGGVMSDDLTPDVLAKGLAVLETAVLSWHGVLDADGRPLPASRAGYMHDDLDPELGDWIVDAITAHYAVQRRPADAEGKAEAPTLPEPSSGVDTLTMRFPSPSPTASVG